MGIILCGPFFLYIKDIPLKLFEPNAILGWDIVSYHLPAWIEFYQNHSLWSTLGPYQSYSFAFELIGMFLSQGFHAHWGLLIAHLVTLALLVGSISLVCKGIAQSNSGYSLGHLISIVVFALGIWSLTATQSYGGMYLFYIGILNELEPGQTFRFPGQKSSSVISWDLFGFGYSYKAFRSDIYWIFSTAGRSLRLFATGVDKKSIIFCVTHFHSSLLYGWFLDCT